MALLGIILFPCLKKSFHEKILKFLTALAAGTLFSDAMLHIVPEVASSFEIFYLDFFFITEQIIRYWN